MSLGFYRIDEVLCGNPIILFGGNPVMCPGVERGMLEAVAG